jgi:regulator of protease activity HflC (stomatin/prohibitin superfamily)
MASLRAEILEVVAVTPLQSPATSQPADFSGQGQPPSAAAAANLDKDFETLQEPQQLRSDTGVPASLTKDVAEALAATGNGTAGGGLRTADDLQAEEEARLFAEAEREAQQAAAEAEAQLAAAEAEAEAEARAELEAMGTWGEEEEEEEEDEEEEDEEEVEEQAARQETTEEFDEAADAGDGDDSVIVMLVSDP